MAWWWLPVLVAAGWPALNFAIQRGLTAPRVAETTDPGALPWEVVHLPTANEKRLFGWFIPATPGAPALVVMHGWGGNAEMMLPLAAPLHAAGYSLLLVDARCHGSPSAGSARPTIPSGQSSRAPGPAASAAHAPARRTLGRLRTEQELPDSSSL
jgi:uncharacterized protein